MTNDTNLLLSIDTASDTAGVALHREGALLAETSWYSYQSHTRDLLPVIDWLLQLQRLDKHDLTALAVSLGPGSYAGLRVGLSTAKTLSYALSLPLVGIGRLAADALVPAEISGRRTHALQAAGRAELARATYEAKGDELVEVTPPALVSRETLLASIEKDDLVVGDSSAFKDGLDAAIIEKSARIASPSPSRATAVGRLALRRLARGEFDNADSLVPLYLRAPAIGPQS